MFGIAVIGFIYQTGGVMLLSKSDKNKWYQVSEISSEDSDLEFRFYKMGIYPGARIMLKRSAPIFKDPVLIQVELSQFALSKKEAQAIKVGELCQ